MTEADPLAADKLGSTLRIVFIAAKNEPGNEPHLNHAGSRSKRTGVLDHAMAKVRPWPAADADLGTAGGEAVLRLKSETPFRSVA